jgi:hypothetical protein
MTKLEMSFGIAFIVLFIAITLSMCFYRKRTNQIVSIDEELSDIDFDIYLDSSSGSADGRDYAADKSHIFRAVELIRAERIDKIQLVCTNCIRPFIETDKKDRHISTDCPHQYHIECMGEECLVDICQNPKVDDPELIQRRPGFPSPPTLKVRINTFEYMYQLPPRDDNVPKFKPNQFYDRMAWHKLQTLQEMYKDCVEFAVTITVVNEYYTEWKIDIDTQLLDEFV